MEIPFAELHIKRLSIKTLKELLYFWRPRYDVHQFTFTGKKDGKVLISEPLENVVLKKGKQAYLKSTGHGQVTYQAIVPKQDVSDIRIYLPLQ